MIPEMTQSTSMCVKHGTTVRFLKFTNNPQTCYYENNTILKGVFIHMAVYSLFLIIIYGPINQRSPLNDALKTWKRFKLYAKENISYVACIYNSCNCVQ